MLAPPQNFSTMLASPMEPLSVVTKKEDLLPGISDGLLAVLAPVIAYWTYATVFHIIDVYELAEKYRIHPSEEEESRNKVSLAEVLRDVALQHVIQTVVGYCVCRYVDVPTTGNEFHSMWNWRQNILPAFIPDSFIWYAYMYGWSAVRLLIALCIIDTWQYWLHRLMHTNKALYRRFHSRHHRLYVPYSYGALYNDPVEGFLLDTAGTSLAAILAALSPRESLILYTFATMKTVDDHCGYRFPFDPSRCCFLTTRCIMIFTIRTGGSAPIIHSRFSLSGTSSQTHSISLSVSTRTSRNTSRCRSTRSSWSAESKRPVIWPNLRALNPTRWVCRKRQKNCNRRPFHKCEPALLLCCDLPKVQIELYSPTRVVVSRRSILAF